MSPFIPLPDPAGVIRLGWTLVHFIWQGFAVGLLLALALGLRRAARPQWRYAAACLALLLLAAAPVATFFSPLARPSGVARVLTAAPVLPVALPLTVSTALSAPVLASPAGPGHGPEGWLPLFVAIWVVGVIVFIARLLTGWWGLRRLRTRETSSLGEPWRVRLAGLAARVGVTRPVALLQSALVEAPTVLGWLRPVILLPASTLTGLKPAQIDAILVHELAHIRRHDYLVNWAQRVLEALLFYHPVVWWVSRRIREERELCCDDVVVSVCGDPVDYARALASLEELRAVPGQLALGADGGSLLARIQRLLGVAPNPTRAKRVRVIGLLLVGAGLCAFALNYDPRPRYEAKLRVVVYPDSKATPFDFAKLMNFTNSSAVAAPAASATPVSYDPAWVATEIEVMRSSVVLDKIVFHLDLGYKLRMREQDKSPRPNGWAGNILRDRVRLRQVPGTSMVEVTATGADEAEARSIAETVVRAYLEFRGEQQNKTALARLRELEGMEEQLRRRLHELMRVTITDEEPSALPGTGPNAASFRDQMRERQVVFLQDAHNAITTAQWRLSQGRPVVNPELAVIVDRFPVVAKGGLLW